jgi:two-component system, cell cycle response regulator
MKDCAPDHSEMPPASRSHEMMSPRAELRPTILVVDDSESMRKTIEVALRQEANANLISVPSGTEALQILASHSVDLILCDLEMPGIDGRKLLQFVRNTKAHENTPFVMLTGHEAVDTKVDVLLRGANDYLTKPFHAAELRARLRVHLQLKRLQDELAEKNERLEMQSRTDPLTDVANRRHLEKTIRIEMIRALRYNTRLTFIMIDVDHFKAVNDNHGHVAGDCVLREVAKRLRTGIRACDLVARFGGEEFCLLLPQTDSDGGRAVAERYREAIADQPMSTGASEISVTASFGVVTYPHSSLQSLDDVVRAADTALYSAKNTGRNRVEVAPLSSD